MGDVVSAPGVIAVTGLGSFMGRRLVDRLLERSPQLRVIALDHRRPFRLDSRVRFHRIDLTEPTADGHLAEILMRERVEAVVHAAFRTSPTPDLEMDHELETIGSLHVMNACAAAKVKRLVVASSSMLYGPRPDNPNFLTEAHPLRGHPDSHTVEDRVEMEGLLAEWRDRHTDTEVTVLRPCWIMGPSYWDHVTRFFSLPVVPMLLGYDPLMQFVHEEDCLRAFERATVNPTSPLDHRAPGGQAHPAPAGPGPLPHGVLPLPGPDRRSSGGLL
jgi:UDP-glucose 4-epimerase